MSGVPHVDFFISHAGRDRAWAEWVAWQVREAGYQVVLDTWDWAAGDNFVVKMRQALDSADRVLALFSSAYFESHRYTEDEWSAALVGDAEGIRRLVPVRIEDTPPPRLLQPLLAPALFGLDERQARQTLIEAVRGPRPPDRTPMFPGTADQAPPAVARSQGPPRLPGTLPSVWNIPGRNASFVGRDGLVVRLREQLQIEERAVAQVLCGLGGVGKSQLAVEYAYRFAGDYDLGWWVAAGQASLIGEQLAAAAVEVGVAEAGVETAIASHALARHLRSSARWLLVFDNAEDPDELRHWIPAGYGHVLITSRTGRWDELADVIEVDVFARRESLALIRRRVVTLRPAEADQLATALGDLALAVTQAAGVLAETGMTVEDYLSLLRSRASSILDEGRPVSYPVSLAAAVRLSVDRLTEDDPAAVQLLRLCSFLAPAPIPLPLFAGGSEHLPEPLCSIARQPLTLGNTAARIVRYGLARVDARGLQLHRLIQAVLRDQVAEDDHHHTRVQGHQLLIAAHPGYPDDPRTWSGWAQLLPHLIAAEPATADHSGIREFGLDATRYLLVRGDTRTGLDLAEQLYRSWSHRLGAEDAHTLTAAIRFGHALHNLGRYADAERVNAETLAIRRRWLGEEHPDTLRAANGLALNLRARGEPQRARDMDQETLTRRRRALGEDHPETLLSATNLAADLRMMGDVVAARQINEETLNRYRLTLGDDHPDTLRSANNLAADLRQLSQFALARELDELTHAGRRRVLGEDHPDTLLSATHLASDLRALGEVGAAMRLDSEALTRYRKTLGDDHPDTTRSAVNLAADRRLLDIAPGSDGRQ